MTETQATRHEAKAVTPPLQLTPAETRWGKVIGVDSVGNPVVTGSLLLTEKGRHLTLRGVPTGRAIDPESRALAIGEGDNLNPALLQAGEGGKSMVEFEILRRDVIDLTDIMRHKDEYGPQLDAHLQEGPELMKTRPRAEDRWRSDFKTVWFERNGLSTSDYAFGYIGVPEVDDYDRCNFKIHYTDETPMQVSLYPKESIAIPTSDSMIVLTLIVNENNGRYYLVPSHPKFSDAVPAQKAQRVEFSRLASQEDVYDRLRRDFPWLKSDDIFPLGPHVPLQQVGDGDADIDETRFKQIYDSSREHEVKRQKPNDFEEQYIAARNYCHEVQLAYQVEHPNDDTATVAGQLGALSRKDKEGLVEQFVARVEENKRALLEPRRLKERELFGHHLPDLSRLPKRRYVSGNTIYPDEYLGKYYINTDTIALVTDMSDGGIFEKGKDSYAALAELESHEEGHAIVLYDKEAKWPRRELWNEWVSVIYPRRLQGQEVQLDSLYHQTLREPSNFVTLEQQHGAFELDKMVQELVAKAQTGKLKYKNRILAPEDVERSVLASAFAQKERGEFVFMDTPVVAFADLYDASAMQEGHNALSGFSLLPSRLKRKQPSPFEQRLAGCEDVTYRQHTEKRKKKTEEGRQVDINKAFVRAMRPVIVSACKEVLEIGDDSLKTKQSS